MFIDKLLFLMKENNVTKKRLCEDLGIGINQIKYWEKNSNIPSAETVNKIANYFHVSIDFLLNSDDYEISDNSQVSTNFKNILVENDDNAVFWDKFLKLCNDRQVAPSAVCDDIGLSNSSPSKWKNGATPNSAALHRIAEYFGLPADYFKEARMMRKHLTPVRRPKDGKPANISLTDEEIELIKAYRQRKDMQAAVKTLLGMDKKLTTIFRAAKSSIYDEPELIDADEDFLFKLENAPESDDDLM